MPVPKTALFALVRGVRHSIGCIESSQCQSPLLCLRQHNPDTSPYSGTEDISLPSTLGLLASASGIPPSDSGYVPALCN